jgi:hypothetical protein
MQHVSEVLWRSPGVQRGRIVYREDFGSEEISCLQVNEADVRAMNGRCCKKET